MLFDAKQKGMEHMPSAAQDLPGILQQMEPLVGLPQMGDRENGMKARLQEREVYLNDTLAGDEAAEPDTQHPEELDLRTKAMADCKARANKRGVLE